MAGRLAAASRFRRRVLLGSRRRPAGERSVDTFVLPGLQHTSLLYVIPCRYSYPCIPLLLMRIQFGAISVCPDFRAKRQLFGMEPVPRPVTNIRVPKRKNRRNPKTDASFTFLSSLTVHHLPSRHGHPERARSERCQLVEHRRWYACFFHIV